LLQRINHVAAPTTAGAGLGECPECGERLERMRGLASAPPATAGYRQEKLGTRSLVRVGMNRYTETAQDQMLYVQDVLEPGRGQDGQPKQLRFVGRWRGSAQQAEHFQAMLKEHLLPAEGGGFHLRIGMARARGLGAVQLYMTSPQPLDEAAQRQTIANRLAQFQPGQAGGEMNKSGHLYAALTLRSPVQLLDEQGAPITHVTAQHLRDDQSMAPANLEIVPECSVLEQEIASGWSASWGLPKPVAPALAAGSVLVVRAPEDERQAFLDFLLAVEQQGLGERRGEGWGEVLICDHFHSEFDEREAQSRKGAGQ
jgi:CRISPR-associated protein Csx10